MVVIIRGVGRNHNTPDSGKALRSRVRQELERLFQARARLEADLIALSYQPLVAGSLITKYKRCNKGGCRCTRGEPHGPFWYLSQTVGGRTVMRFLRAAWVSRVRAAYERTKRWRQRRAAWVRMQQQILRRLDRLAEEATVPVERLERR